ncbi:MAG: DUF4363 family protein [Eubacteriales bacterium]|nr:DUF4363 family protein [Eubacteriales bacterium]
MRRAVLLIVILTVVSVGLGLWMDFSQRDVAREYLDGAAQIRSLLLEAQWEKATYEQAYQYARWQGDAKWLNCFLSHHHTRAVSTAMVELGSALEYGWEDEALRALDQLEDALGDVESSDFPHWENIL